MQRRVNQSKIHTIVELKQRLIEVWCSLEQLTSDMAIDQCRRRLRACVHVKGGYFERTLLIALILSTFCHLFRYVLLKFCIAK